MVREVHPSELHSLDDVRKEMRHFINKPYISQYVSDFAELSFNEQKQWSKLNGAIRDISYARDRKRKLGDLSKAMPEHIFHQLVDHFSDRPKLRMLVLTQGYLGLRVSEVVKLKCSSLDFVQNLVTVDADKTDRMERVPMPKTLREELRKYVFEFDAEIKRSGGFLFPSDYTYYFRNHIHPQYYARKIVEALDQLGVNTIYTTDIKGKKRRLYTSHSLRGFGITKFYIMSNYDIYRTMKFSRHRDIKSLLLYLENQDDVTKKVVSSY